MSIDELFDEVKGVVDDYLRNFYDSYSMQRVLVAPSSFVIRDVDYSRLVEFVGTAHFSERSVSDALKVVKDTKPVGICLELCPFRYEYLKRVQEDRLMRSFSLKRSEFVATVDFLGGVELDVWLIDMNQEEIAARVLTFASVEEARAWKRIQEYLEEREVVGLRLWEEGLKDEAMKVFNGDVELMRKTFPTLWKVLILERNVFMACNLVFLTSHYLDKNLKEFKIVVFVGAVHVEGIKQLLKQPEKAFQALESLGISFTEPYKIKRN